MPQLFMPAIDFMPMVGRVVLVIKPHHRLAIYELEIEHAQALVAELYRVVEVARHITDEAPIGPIRASPPPFGLERNPQN